MDRVDERRQPLYARELVSGALESGALAAEDGTWRLREAPRLSQRWVDLVALNLGGLDAAERHAIEIVALAEPLELVVLEQLVDMSTLPRLERRGLIAMSSTSGDTTVRCAHPLYAEVLVATIGVASARALRSDLADALERVGTDRPGRALRLATWRLDADRAADAPVLTTAAMEAIARGAARRRGAVGRRRHSRGMVPRLGPARCRRPARRR